MCNLKIYLKDSCKMMKLNQLYPSNQPITDSPTVGLTQNSLNFSIGGKHWSNILSCPICIMNYDGDHSIYLLHIIYDIRWFYSAVAGLTYNPKQIKWKFYAVSCCSIFCHVFNRPKINNDPQSIMTQNQKWLKINNDSKSIMNQNK